MKISLYPPRKQSTNCLILVGGDGDTIEVFAPLTQTISSKLPNHQICTFDFTTESQAESILDINTRELTFVCDQLITKHGIKTINIWCTSRGAYPTVKLLQNEKYAKYVRRVIMYDPADYYLSETDLYSWSGSLDYNPSRSVVSDDLVHVKGDCIVDVVHLKLRNYGPNGYLQNEYKNRGLDDPLGFPRLNTRMVKAFYAKLPLKSRGKYLEDQVVPHGFVRDGDIDLNYKLIVDLVADILTS